VTPPPSPLPKQHTTITIIIPYKSDSFKQYLNPAKLVSRAVIMPNRKPIDGIDLNENGIPPFEALPMRKEDPYLSAWG